MDRQRRGGNNSYRGNRKSPRKGSFRGCPFRGQYKWYSQRGFTPQKDYRNEEYGTHFKRPLRPASPIEGSEEYMTRKIQQTSAIIMRQLLDPQEPVMSKAKLTDNDKQKDHKHIDIAKATRSQFDNKLNNKTQQKTKKVNTANLNAKEIHEKIMNHITNLNKGRQHNFVHANSSIGLDSAIENMQKRQRLEISKILRDMNSSSTTMENGDYTNSIVPDIGIKIEELPFDVIEELKQTLNLDLEYLNEVIADSSNNFNNCNDLANVERLEINNLDFCQDENILAERVEVKEEVVDSYCPNIEDDQDNRLIDMDLESASDLSEKQAATENKEEVIDIVNHSIKEEDKQSLDSLDNCSASTVLVCPHRCRDVESQTVVSSISNTDSLSSHTLNTLESTIRQFIENDEDPECTQDNALEKIDLVDLCVKHLTNYRRSLTQSILSYCKRDRSSQSSSTEATPGQNTQPLTIVGANQSKESSQKKTEVNFNQITFDDKRPANKKRKLSQEDIEIKSEPDDCLEVEHILKFPNIVERIIATERLENELLLATESGNIIFVSLKDGAFVHRLDVTQCAITSFTILRGMNDFMYLYVGSLEEVLRVYDLRKRQLLKASRIDDKIVCMDSMWDYVFMGCKNGTIIRYSCKKAKVEYEDKNFNNEILVLRASQEGPRRVLLVGHRQAPIYVRDAMSGLYLRSFSSIAITPTVYSLILNNGHLYCGTAKNDILVFSFHEGQLLEKLVTDNSKGISCMKIRDNLLFAGCYNGAIYVYNLIVSRLVTVLKGPGGGIMCMEILSNQVIVGTLTGQFVSIGFPSELS